LKVISRKNIPKIIQVHIFKEKEKEIREGKPQLGGQWKVPMLGGQ
jgi:hypothetical protein